MRMFSLAILTTHDLNELYRRICGPVSLQTRVLSYKLCRVLHFLVSCSVLHTYDYERDVHMWLSRCEYRQRFYNLGIRKNKRISL